MTTSSFSGPLRDDEKAVKRLTWRSYLAALAYGILFVLFTMATLVIQWPLSGQYNLEVGDVSPVDIRAPERIEYISESLTEQRRLEAELRVPDVYEPQRRVRTEQVAYARDVLDYIETVRYDTFASDQEKLVNLVNAENVPLEEATWQQVLDLEEEPWQRIRNEVPAALNVIMLREIRDTQLASARRTVPNYIDLEDEDEADVAIALVQGLLKPNAFYNSERTEIARQEIRNKVPSETVSYEQNEIIIRQGDVVEQRHIEALNELGLNQPGWDWWQLLSALLISLALAAVFGLSLYKNDSAYLLDNRQMGLLMALLATFLLLVKLMVPGRPVFAYVFPLAALTMLIGPLLGQALTFLVTIYFGIIIGYLTDGSVAIVTYAVIGALIGTLVLGRAERTTYFVRAGAAVALSNLVLLLAFNVPLDSTDLGGYAELAVAAAVNGLLVASITLIGFYLLGAIFDLATPLRLMELARPNHPLLRELMMKAPGTYHHSLLVSNLAEQAAEAVGADAFLTRVGAYYHDIGKLARPYFFVENRLEGTDPHDQLDPWSSAQIIISHVKDGQELARRHKLPRRIRDFISEHQGTGLVRMFYLEAQKISGEDQVDEADFRYPGPKPQSKETALLMLADSCESAVRAARPESKEEIDEIVRKIINGKLIGGQLSESDLTLRDMERARKVFVRSLQGVHHPRIKYPEPKPEIEEPLTDEPAQVSAATGS
ncbi:MAG: HDIG domain-containing protein [Chloroflexota bacterium]|nr:HDIG domain-containing protein [Chloroflexota bacterium]